MMKNKKLISAILAAASIAGGVVGAQAADASTLEAKVDSYTSRVQQAEKDIKGLQTKVDALDTTGIADNKAGIEANKNAIATQGAQISQLQKDMAQEGMDRVNEMNKLTAKVDQKADKGDVVQNKNDIASNAAAIKTETQKREDAVKGLQDKLTVANGQIENEKTTRENAVNDLQKQVTANKNAIATQGSQISQIQQDMAQDAMDHAAEMDKLTTKVNQKADKVDVEANKNDIASNAAAIKTETQKREDAVKGLQDKLTVANGQIENEKTTRENAVNDLQNQVTTNKTAIATQGAQISQLQKDMAQEGMDRVNEMNKLTAKVDQKADKGDVVQNKNDIASNAAAIKTETQKREDAVKGLQDKLTVANGQIENEKTTRENADKAETAARIAGDNALNSRINQVESDANKGIAKASALAALHPLDYDPDNKFDIAAAGGFYKGENAFALGAFYRPNRNVMLSMGTTLTSGDNAYNVGVTFKIGKSGKHTEAGLTTADLYAMIGAMQDKMDQQQKKIEELEAKQAK